MNRREFNLGLIGAGAATGLPGLAGCAGSPASPRVTRVDTHAHVFHRGLSFIPNGRYTPDYDATTEQHLALLDANGISNGVVIRIRSPSRASSHSTRAVVFASSGHL